jgi:hypothetical protein
MESLTWAYSFSSSPQHVRVQILTGTIFIEILFTFLLNFKLSRSFFSIGIGESVIIQRKKKNMKRQKKQLNFVMFG